MKCSPLRAALAALLSVGALAAVAPGTASAAGLTADAGACAAPDVAQPFTRWLDTAHYFLAPGGDFEAGTKGWSLDGARVVGDQEPWDVTGVDGDSALEIPAGATVTSPTVCAGLAEPTLRLFAKSKGVLVISVRTRLLTGTPVTLPVGVATGDTWKPTLAYAMVLNALGIDGKAPVQVVLTSLGGSSRVDDVHIDPWRAR